MRFDVQHWRRQFPGLSREIDGRPAVFLDGPAGSQVPRSVAEAVSAYMIEINANCGGPFVTSVETERMLGESHRAVADFLGSDEPDLVAFGSNMTTLTLALARALSRTLEPTDEIVVTSLEHDANFTPWVQAARDAGAEVRRISIHPDDCTLDLDDLRSKVNANTRLVAVGAASNAVGTINPVRQIADIAHEAGARLFVDAVHYAPHRPIDVAAWDCDYVACSAYKFFGPHVGMLWGKRELLESLPAYKLRPSSDALPDRWMTGTQNHEGIAGTLAAIDYLADLGRAQMSGSGDAGRRDALLAAFTAIDGYERELSARMLTGLAEIEGVRVWGITDLERASERVPTISITHASHTPLQMSEALGRRGIFTWYGNYYALPLTEALGLEPDGMLRIGLLHYNTADEIDRLLQALTDL